MTRSPWPARLGTRATALSHRTQVCRRLEAAGRLHRCAGADGKIVNELRDTGDEMPLTVSTQPVETLDALPPGSSHEQREAEAVMLALLGERLGLALRPRRIHSSAPSRT